MARKGHTATTKHGGKTRLRNIVPDVYREMLTDAAASSSTDHDNESRPIKRRRVGGRIVTKENNDGVSHRSTQGDGAADDHNIDDLFNEPAQVQQKIVQSGSEDSADSDIGWEEVELQDQLHHGSESDSNGPAQGELDLVLTEPNIGQKSAKGGRQKRKPMTDADKQLRLDIHKMHLCGLLANCFLRNHWCNDEMVHSFMRKILHRKAIVYLNPNDGMSQFQRSRSFIDGLTQASDIFRGKFRITARGMGKSRWADSPETLSLLQPPDDIDLPMQIMDFRSAAQKMEGSRDIGAHLFCALLRATDIDTRIVCSLQALPFQSAPKVELSQVLHQNSKLSSRKHYLNTLDQEAKDTESSDQAPSEEEATQNEVNDHFASKDQNYPDHFRQSASPVASSTQSHPTFRRKITRPIRESKFPIYWVEAFNEAVQKWVPVDPLVTRSIGKPSKFEPPASERENSMHYVIAFEDEGSARDVTRRYAKAFNAKTRRDRVEVTKGGERWWRRVLKLYKRQHDLDRDQVEDAELTAKEAAEPMPRNVQDFKDHPYYALERHLKRSEAIHPRREVGKLGTGRSSSSNVLEPIFRRRDVHQVKSADKWYRMGREIKPGEQPLKRVKARRKREESVDPNDEDRADQESALYAFHQTTAYSAPPVVGGRIPKNIYGNLDLYVPSMVPRGGIHIPHPETARAAKTLGIDYADAVTGFVFKGRHGTAVFTGAVVASEYQEAVEEVIRAFENECIRIEEEKRSIEALRTWKRLLAGLRIRERIEGYDIEGQRDIDDAEYTERVDDSSDHGDGGFFADPNDNGYAMPTAGNAFSNSGWQRLHNSGLGSATDNQYGHNPNHANKSELQSTGHLVNRFEEDSGGGLLTEDDDEDVPIRVSDRTGNTHSHLGKQDEKSGISTATDSTPDIRHDGGFTTNASEAKYQDDQPEGFETMPDDEATSEEFVPDPNPSREIVSDIAEDELAEAKILQQLYETDKAHARAVVPNIEHSHPYNQQANNTQIEKAYTKSKPDAISSPKAEISAEEPSEPGFSDDDKGSLLSEDPDDNEEDPEWLD